MRSLKAFIILMVLLMSALSFTQVTYAMDELVVDNGQLSDNPPRSNYKQQDGGNDTRLFQYRSMWFEGYQIINHSEVLKVIEVAKYSHINCLSPLINGNYLGNFYNSSYHPRYKELSWDFDPLMDLTREAHKYGIHVMPWFHTMIDYQALKDHPEWGCVSNTGSRSTAWLNPTLPAVQSHLANVTQQLMRDYPIDGIKLDTIRYPASNYGYDPYSIQMYYKENWTDFNAFRRQQITECAVAISDAINEVRPYVWIGADIFADTYSRQNYVFQDSELWSQQGIIDLVTPMLYTTSLTAYKTYVELNMEQHSCPVVAGTYIYTPGNLAHGSVPDNETGISIMLSQIGLSMESGALGSCLFAYKFLLDFPSYQTALRTGNFSDKALFPLKEQSVPVSIYRWEFERDHDREGFRVVDMGHQYPFDGVWSISGVIRPALMTPLLNITAQGTNVIEVSMISEAQGGSLRVYWSSMGTTFTELDMVEVPLADDGDWHLYSIHLDKNPRWKGGVTYLRIVPLLPLTTNITLDLIRLYWMPDCIKDWSCLGPFMSGGTTGLVENDLLGGEKEVFPRLGTLEAGRRWEPFGMDRDLIDLRFLYGGLKYSVVYAHIYIIASEDGPFELRLGTSDGTRVFLNGELIIENIVPRRVSPDQNVTPILLKKGPNRLMVKIVVYDNELSFYSRITRPGNFTTNELEYLLDLPRPSSPEPRSNPQWWGQSSEVTISWELPDSTVPISHYEWSLDSGQISTIGTEKVTISGISNGWHEFHVRAFDVYKTSSNWSKTGFGVDPIPPLVSIPVTPTQIVREPRIGWSWDILQQPSSGIGGTWVMVSYIAQNGDRGNLFPKEVPIDGTEFYLVKGIVDTYSYRLKVRVESIAGVSSVVESPGAVIVDMFSPPSPTGLNLELVNSTLRTYELTWSRSIDNINEGTDHYELYLDDQEGTRMVGTTTEERFLISRELGQTGQLYVIAVDKAGLRSLPSKPLAFENIPPVPVITVSKDNGEGGPMVLSGLSSKDPDGSIVSYKWSLDGKVISTRPETFLTMGIGTYELIMIVYDDVGASSSLSLRINVQGKVGPFDNMTLREFLDSSNQLTVELPMENRTIHNNITVMDPPSEDHPLVSIGSALKGAMYLCILLVPLTAAGGLLISIVRKRTVVNREEKSTNIDRRFSPLSEIISNKKVVYQPNPNMNLITGRAPALMRPGPRLDLRIGTIRSLGSPQPLSQSVELAEWTDVGTDEDIDEFEVLEDEEEWTL